MSYWLQERLEQWGDSPALVWEDRVTTYAALRERIAHWQTELAQRGIGPGSTVALEGSFSSEACALLLALLFSRAIAVPLTRQMQAQRAALLELAEVQWLICFDDNDQAEIHHPGHLVSHSLLTTLIAEEKSGLVIFSSGSSGTPKAILHDFAALLAKFEKPRQRKTTLGFLLFDHIGGLDTLMGTLASGGTLVSVARRDPDTIAVAIERHRVHTLPTSPTFLNLLLLSEAYRHHDLSSLQVITYGTEPMPERTLQRLREVFPEVALVQTYGLSELGVLRSRSKDSGSLWVKFRDEGFETQVREGILWVRSPGAMRGYLNAPELFDADGWLNTQDAVEFDETGEYLRILGRVTDLINVGGQKVYPAEVENILMQLENVRDVAVVGETNPLTGQIVTARFNLIEPEELPVFKRRLRAFCQSRLAPYQAPVRVAVTEAEVFGARFKKRR